MNTTMNSLIRFLKPIMFVTMLGFSFLVSAQDVSASKLESPDLVLKRISDEVMGALNEQRELLDTEPQRLFDIVEKYIIPNLDDVTMAKLALGKNWRKANNDQKIDFVDEFRELLVLTYSKSLREFKDQKINFFPVKITAETKKVVVKSEVIQPDGPVIPVSYKMRVKGDAWKAYDISIDGVSLVTSYRGTFAQEIRKGGMEGLLAMLRDRNKRAKT